MKNKLLHGMITLIVGVILILNFAACDIFDDSFPAAPSGFTATAVSSTDINLTWNPVLGAAGYNVYASLSPSSGFLLLYATQATSAIAYNGSPNTMYYFRVAAYNAIGTEGSMSSASARTLASYSLNGVWETSSGWQVTVSGSTGLVSAFGSPNALTQNAISKGYVSIGSQFFRNLTSTGNLTWSGQVLVVAYNTSAPNVATGTQWTNCTITMNANGQTITRTITALSSTVTFTRK